MAPQTTKMVSKAVFVETSAKKNLFANGTFKGSLLSKKNKDKRHILFVEGMKNGVVTVWLKKHNKNEEPYLAYDMIQFRDDSELCESLGIDAIIARRGEDGETALNQNANSEYDWRQFIFVVGEDANTPATRKSIAIRMVDHLNKNAVTPNYQFPTKVKFGGDRTAEPMAALSSNLLDQHVLQMMRVAYPAMTIADFLADQEIMEAFWDNATYGASFLMENDLGNVIDSEDDNEDDE